MAAAAHAPEDPPPGWAGVREPAGAAASLSNSALAGIEAEHARLANTFRSGRTKSYEWRMEQLASLNRLVRENSKQIIEAMRNDLGRPAAEAFIAEVASVVMEVEYIMKHLKSWMAPEAVPQPMLQKPGRSAIVREPKGVVLNIAPWNFPVNLSLMAIAAIISAGNCCLLKPSEVAPASEKFLLDLIPRYLDTDAVAVVVGGMLETQELLKLRWDHIMYTGNPFVAREVMAAAAKHLTPCTLELGGKSPTVVLPGANLAVAARRILAGKCLNAGQICVAPDYVMAHESIAAALEVELKKTLSSWFSEDAQKSESFGRIVNDRHFKRIKGLLDSAGSAVVHQQGQLDESAKFIPPTLIRGPDDQSALMQEEIFGPLLPFIVCKSVDEIVERINIKEKPLAMYIFGKEAEADEIIQRTSSGGVCVNDTIFHMVSPELPFGGVGNSGMGKYHGKWGFDEFSHHRSVMYRATWVDPPMRYPPYSEGNTRLLEKVMIGPLLPPGVAKKLLASIAAAGAAAAALAVRRSRL